MPLDVRTYLFDIVQAAELIEQFIAGHSFETYTADAMLVSAVERQLMVVGEAVTQVKKLEADLKLPNASQIIGFRNILVHNYARVSQALVWTIVHDHLPKLKTECQGLLEA